MTRPAHFRKLAKSRGAMKSSLRTLSLIELELAVEDWIAAGRRKPCSERTLETRQYILDRLRWYLGHAERGALEASDVVGFFDYLASAHKSEAGRWDMAKTDPRCLQPLRRASLNTFFSYLRAFFRWLRRNGRVSVDMMEGIEAPGPCRDQPVGMSPTNVLAMVAGAQDTIAPVRNEAIILLFYDTGIRVSELANAKVSDLKLSSPAKLRVDGKGDKSRVVALGRGARAAVFKYMAERGNLAHDYLFVSYGGTAPGEPMTPSGIRRVVRYCCRNGGVGEPGVKNSPHAIRHAFARDYVKAGANVITLMNALGHSSLEMSRKYVRLAEGDMSEQHAKLSPVDALRDRERKKTQR